MRGEVAGAMTRRGHTIEVARRAAFQLSLAASSAQPRAHAVARAVELLRLAWLQLNHRDVFEELFPAPPPALAKVCA